jgi:phosphoribosyl 1,2-cyclic phosphodiesterase
VQLTFLGVRGSTPAPGPEFVRYGGHTSCIAVAHDAATAPALALDAGTGLRALSALLGGAAFDGSILLSHLHWDHVQGLPFFVAGDRDDSRVDVILPAQAGRSGRDLVAQLLAPPAFPITPEGLKGAWSFTAVEPGPFEAAGFHVDCAPIAHKGGQTYAYRVESGGRSVVYAPDHAPAAGITEAALDLMRGTDVLIHDAQFLEPERQWADAFGHATVADAVALGERVGAGSVVLFHHGPGRTDEALDRITAGVTSDATVIVACEGQTLDV